MFDNRQPALGMAIQSKNSETKHGGTYDGFCVDIWAVGVILYALVTKALPFGKEGGKHGMSQTQIFQRIINRDATPFIASCSAEVRALWDRLCTRDPVGRPTAQILLAHISKVGKAPATGFTGLKAPVALTRGLDWLQHESSYIPPALRPPLQPTHSIEDLLQKRA